MSGRVVLITGDDASLVADAVRHQVDELVGDADRTLVVEELTEESYSPDDHESHDLDRLVDAAQTPPFLTDFRVVVGRHLARFGSKEAVASLVQYLDDPLDTTHLVLVWDKGPRTQKASPVPKSLRAAVEAAGGQVRSAMPARGQVDKWLDAQIERAGVRLDRTARKSLADHIGEEHGRIPGTLDALRSVYGGDVELTADQIAPYLGEAGGVPPWDLTDAIARGDTPAALANLTRMLGAERHPFQVLASLTTHYQRLLRLDGAGARGEKEAAALLGLRGSTYPAKKALGQLRTMGRVNVHAAIGAIARADLDMRGATGLDETTVLELLVVRLAELAE